TSRESFAINLSGGTSNYRRITADGNMPITDTIGFRINLMAHQNDAVGRDVVHSSRWGVAPSITIGMGTDTSFTAIFLHQDEDRVPDYGVPIALTASATDIELPVTEYGVGRSAFYGFAGSDADHSLVNTLTLLFDHRASDTLSFNSDTKLGAYSRYFRQAVASCAAATCGAQLLDGVAGTVPVASVAQRGAYDQLTRGIQNVSSMILTAPVGGLRNEFAIGWDISYQTNDRTQYANGAAVNKDLFNPANSGAAILPTTLDNVRDTTGTDVALFIEDRLWMLPTLSVNLGLRYQHYVNEQDQLSYGATLCNGVTQAAGLCAQTMRSSNNLWSPKAAIIWEPSNAVSAYLSYSRALVPPGNAVGNGDALSALTASSSITRSDLPPERTTTYDAGVKIGLFGQRVLVQSSIYQIDRANATEVDPTTNFVQYSPEPAQRLRGFELGVSGGITPQLRLSANYAYIDSENISAYTGSTGTSAVVVNTAALGKQVRYVPKHAASLWAAYNAGETGPIPGLEIGGGLTHQSRVYLNSENTQAAPGYVVYDAMIAYNIGGTRIALNGYNLTNRLYYSQVNGSRVVPGAGRSLVASVNFAF
ncbi:MAG: TonB-dependent receptor, partial [Sphingopyxis sp.]